MNESSRSPSSALWHTARCAAHGDVNGTTRITTRAVTPLELHFILQTPWGEQENGCHCPLALVQFGLGNLTPSIKLESGSAVFST